MAIQVSITSKEAKEIIRKCLNEAAYFNDATMPYDIIARTFAEYFRKKNPKFNSRSFLRRCSTDYKGDSIYIHN